MALIVIEEHDYEIRPRNSYDPKPTDQEIVLSAKLMSDIQNGNNISFIEQAIAPAIQIIESPLIPGYIDMVPQIVEDTAALLDGLVVESSFSKVGKFFKGVANFFVGDDEDK